MSPRLTPRSAAEWSASLPTYVAAIGLLGCLLFWMATGKIETVLVSTFGTLLAAGQLTEVLLGAKSPPPPPTLPSKEEEVTD